MTRALLALPLALALAAAASPRRVDIIRGVPAHSADGGTAASSDTQQAILQDLHAWDIQGAKALVDKLAKRSPDDPGTKYLEGRVAFEQGDYGRAVDLYREAMGPDAAQNSDDFRLAKNAQEEMENAVAESSAHFVVRYQPGKDAALVPFALDTLERSYAALEQDLGYTPHGKIRVEFLPTPRALAKLSSLSEKAIRTTGTIALCKYNRLMVTTPRALVRGYDWQDTLNHELTHWFITHKTRNTVPIWLHEGIAKYEETRWRGKAGLSLGPEPEALLARAVKQHKLVTFEQMSPSIALLPSQEEAALAYAEVETAIAYVDQQKGMAGVRAILDALRGGATDRQAVARAMGEPFARFEANWMKYLAARPPPKLEPGFEKLVFRDDPHRKVTKKEREKAYERGELGTLPNDQARRYAHLGELLRARNRLLPALVEYEKAVALVGATNPALARKYALTLEALNQNAKAEAALKESLAVYPDDETNHLLYGLALLQDGKFAEARTNLLVANRRDPFDPNIHRGLLVAAEKLGDQTLLAQEKEILGILAGKKLTWKAPAPAIEPPAYLRIEAPAGAKVFVDGVDTGLTSPVDDRPLPPGQHDIKLVMPDGKVIEHMMKFAPDEVVPFQS